MTVDGALFATGKVGAMAMAILSERGSLGFAMNGMGERMVGR